MKKYLFLSLILTTSLSYAGDVNLGDVSARLDSIEKRLNGEDPTGEELATKAEVAALRRDVQHLSSLVESMRQQGAGADSSSSTMASGSSRHSFADSHHDDSDSDIDPHSDDDVADLLKDLEKSAPAQQQTDKGKERDKATEEAEKKAPTAKLEKSSTSGNYDEAQEAFNKGDFETAQQMFDAFAKGNPKDNRAKDAKYWALESRLRQAEQDKSKPLAKKSAGELAAYIKANKDSNKTPLAVFGLGRALQLQGDTTKACVAFKQAKAISAKIKIDAESETSLNKAVAGCKK